MHDSETTDFEMKRASVIVMVFADLWLMIRFTFASKILTRSFVSTVRSKTVAAKLMRQITNTQQTR